MTKTYLISEEVLREVLNAFRSAHEVVVSGKSNNSQEWDIDESIKTLRTILASPPAEPFGYWFNRERRFASDEEAERYFDEEEREELLVPLYRKVL